MDTKEEVSQQSADVNQDGAVNTNTITPAEGLDGLTTVPALAVELGVNEDAILALIGERQAATGTDGAIVNSDNVVVIGELAEEYVRSRFRVLPDTTKVAHESVPLADGVVFGLPSNIPENLGGLSDADVEKLDASLDKLPEEAPAVTPEVPLTGEARVDQLEARFAEAEKLQIGTAQAAAANMDLLKEISARLDLAPGAAAAVIMEQAGAMVRAGVVQTAKAGAGFAWRMGCGAVRGIGSLVVAPVKGANNARKQRAASKAEESAAPGPMPETEPSPASAG